MHPFDQLLCSPDYKAYKQTFHNWTNLINQWIDLPTALGMSCDTYFYELGKRFYNLPPDRGHPLQGWANRFGLGELSGIDLSPEVKGLIPTPEWLRQTYTKAKGFGPIDRTWKPGYSIQMAIGQGQILVTPLQMTRLYAMIANGGKLVTPHLADDVELTGSNGHPARVLRRFGAQPAQPSGVDPTALRYVQQGLEEATHASFGTGVRRVRQLPRQHRGQDGQRREERDAAGRQVPAEPDAVVVVRVRPVRPADDRRLRRDRERRPWRHRRRSGGAARVRALLQDEAPHQTTTHLSD